MELIGVFLILSAIAGLVAKNKGRSFWVVFFLSFFLTPLVGFIAALVMKPNRDVLEKVSIETGESQRCPHCAEVIRRDAIVCRYCGRDL